MNRTELLAVITETSAEFLQEKLLQPVISSPMESVTGLEMAKELTKLGCLGILNRFDSSLKKILEEHDEQARRKFQTGVSYVSNLRG